MESRHSNEVGLSHLELWSDANDLDLRPIYCKSLQSLNTLLVPWGDTESASRAKYSNGHILARLLPRGNSKRVYSQCRKPDLRTFQNTICLNEFCEVDQIKFTLEILDSNNNWISLQLPHPLHVTGVVYIQTN